MIISNQQDNEMEHLNKRIQTVAVLGAGAVGCYLIAGLAPKLGENLWIIAEGSRKERLKKEGLTINDCQLSLCVKTPQEAKGADLLIVAVKYGSLEGSLDAIEQIVDDETIVMSVMNGVDSEEIIGHRIGMQHMMYSMIKIASERTGHCVRFNPEVTEGVPYFRRYPQKNMGEICPEYQYESAAGHRRMRSGRLQRQCVCDGYQYKIKGRGSGSGPGRRHRYPGGKGGEL